MSPTTEASNGARTASTAATATYAPVSATGRHDRGVAGVA